MRLGSLEVTLAQRFNGDAALHRPLVLACRKCSVAIKEYLWLTYEEYTVPRFGTVSLNQSGHDLTTRYPTERNTFVERYRGYSIKVVPHASKIARN